MRFQSIIAIAALALIPFQVSAQTLNEEQQEVIRQSLGLPAGSTITLEHTMTRDGGSLRVEEEATGAGAGLNARGEKIVSEFNSTSPGASLGKDKAGAFGGSTDSFSSVLGGSSVWKNPLLWLGLLMMLSGGALVLMRPPTFPLMVPFKFSMILAGAGVGFVVAAVYPAFALVTIVLAVIVVIGPYIAREIKAQQLQKQVVKGNASHEALRGLAAGISDFKKLAKDPSFVSLTPEAWARLKTSIESHLSDEDAATVAAIRKADGLL